MSKINEKLGVPSNITNVGRQVYNEFISQVDRKEIKSGQRYFISNNGKGFDIYEYHINDVAIQIDIDIDDEFDQVTILGMAVSSASDLDNKDYKIISHIDKTVYLTIYLNVPQNTDGEEIRELLHTSKVQLISSITHELKHAYDSFKNSKTSIKSRAKYDSTKERTLGILELNKFLFYMYFTHTIENLVRPSEIASRIESGEITKKEFLEFLTNDSTYQYLKNIQKFSLEEMKQAIINNKDMVADILKSVDDDISNYSTDDALINRMLELVYLHIINTKKSITYKNLRPSFFGTLDDNKLAFFRKLSKEYERFKNNPTAFFEYEINKMHIVADKMIKKISKLYDLTKDNNNVNNLQNKITNKNNYGTN